MSERIATYRLQLRGEMDFDAAIEVLPYLARLGVSHLYLSPIFTATTGSTHGYDVTDFDAIDPALGGRAGFERLSEALKRHRLGLMLDIVPNHMAASPENGWWREVAEWGASAVHAGHFDIDWSEPLTLPILGRPLAGALEAGEIGLRADDRGRGLVLGYYEAGYPITPPSYRLLAEAEPALAPLAAIADRFAPADGAAMHAAMAEAIAAAPQLAAVLDRLSGDRALLARLHEAQPWRYGFWKEARRHLSYRRFFEVTGLVGTRVEDPAVFDDVHRLVLALHREGHVEGLRVDHVDGLADPAGYLHRLRAAAGEGAWIVVEKILESGERLPADWPVEGSTGYEFIAAMADLFVPAEGAARLEAAYASIADAGPAACRRDKAKRRIATHNFAGELERVTGLLASRLPQADLCELRAACAELLVALPVYRTYGGPEGFGEADRAMLDAAAERAAEAADGHLCRAIVSVLAAPCAGEVRARFQQLSGPVMAKAVEDTLFYRHNAVIALNEVGGDPVRPPAGPAAVHATLSHHARQRPDGLLATATHDTKRGEDARARLYALAHRPDEWLAALARWRALLADAARGGAPEPATQWLIHQALAGLWPAGSAPPEGARLEALKERFVGYLVKALREAKLKTSWTGEDPDYEAAVTAHAEALLAPHERRFHADFHARLAPLAEAGHGVSLAQTLIKLTAPGVPDIYQGSEAGDFSLVDPDNRRPVDFAGLDALLAAGASAGDAAPGEDMPAGDEKAFARQKMAVLQKALAERRRCPWLLRSGAYHPLTVAGDDAGLLFAFMRSEGAERAVVVVQRAGFATGAAARARLRRMRVLLPAGTGALEDRLGQGAPARADGGLVAGSLFPRYPVALLTGIAER